MEFKTVLATNKTEFQEITELRASGWIMDPSTKNSGPMSVDGVGVVYHLILYSAEELQALTQAAELATQQPSAPDVESFVSVELTPTKLAPGVEGSKSLVDQYIEKGYVIDSREQFAAKSTKYVNLYKPKPKQTLEPIPIKVNVVTEPVVEEPGVQVPAITAEYTLSAAEIGPV